MAKIEFISKANSDEEIFESLNETTGKWFKDKFVLKR